ncbi:MAG: hypothetical protein BroJett024_22660 [Alphaproteobacteria bacterium]|nr:MAG: hypothetical protein BroJett024_22660 [Alphaproteobacteria bacterium]
MALDLDGFTVAKAIASNSSVFSGIRAEVSKATGAFADKLRSLLVKELKSKATNLNAFQDMRRALGVDSFNLVIEGLKDADLKSIIGKLDKHHPDQKSASAEWRRRHLRALLDGTIQQSLPQPKKKSSARGGKSAAKKTADIEFLEDESAGAVRKRS